MKDDFLNKVDKTIVNNKINNEEVNLSALGIDGNNSINAKIVAGIDNWHPYVGTCPHCGSANIEANYGLVLTSYPPQYNCKCKDCGHVFFSGQSNNENENITPNFPKGPGWVPYNPDPNPVNPGYGYGNRQGWICPRCGKVNSPDRDFCDCSNNNYYPNIFYCNSNNSSGNAPTTSYATTTNIK